MRFSTSSQQPRSAVEVIYSARCLLNAGTFPLFHAHGSQFRISRAVAGCRGAAGRQPCRAARERLLLPVRVDPTGPLDPQVNHYVIVRTALSNIRIITFFAGESEVKIVDPSRIPEVQPFGCEVQFIPPVES